MTMKALVMWWLVALPAGVAHATTVDGRLDDDYGAVKSLQTTATSFGDATPGFTPSDSLTRSYGSELDQGFGFVADATLHLFVAGNIHTFFTEPLTAADQLQLYIDCVPGGQNPLRADNQMLGEWVKLSSMQGLTFDSDFTPDFWFASETPGGSYYYAYRAELPAAGGGSGEWLGRNYGGGTGTLSDGNNPFGILSSIDQANRGGVTAGCDASSGVGVTSGVEWAIPLQAIGNPSGQIRVCAIVVGYPSTVSNQVLGPVPPGTCTLGAAESVDFSTIAGAQYFAIDNGTVAVAPVGGAGAARFSRPPSPNPSAAAVSFTIAVPHEQDLDLAIYDIGGRLVTTLWRGRAHSGIQAFRWNGASRSGERAATGLYVARLRSGATSVSRLFTLLR